MNPVTLWHGDCLEAMATLPENSVEAIVTDPPYGLSFMQKNWDHCVPGQAYWAATLRVLKPGGFLLAFGGSRTYHRLTCSIEDAGFEVRDCLMWIYSNSFPKSMNVSAALDKSAGAKRTEVLGVKPGHEEFAGRTTKGHLEFKQGTDGFDRPWMHDDAARERYHLRMAPVTKAAKQWDGWGTALKPAYEPIVLARKPLTGTVADNLLAHGVGAINIDGCRVPVDAEGADKSQLRTMNAGRRLSKNSLRMSGGGEFQVVRPEGRWPANILHDGSEEVESRFPSAGGQRGSVTGNEPSARTNNVFRGFNGRPTSTPRCDGGSAARFFYCAKASRSERDAGLTTGGNMDKNNHPTVKPVALMRYLCRLITPPGGTVLDIFMGSGSTGVAALAEGFRFQGIEKDIGYMDIAKRRLDEAVAGQARQHADEDKTGDLFEAHRH